MALMAALPAFSEEPDQAGQLERGRQLFSGELELAARLLGHDIDLPTLASRCINCHEARDKALTADGRQGDVPPETYAVALSGQGLTTPRSRRGGPPSAFDVASLCTMLRTGVDPASIIVSTTMPRYEISDVQCEDLWVYLQSR
jgi:hypothetical protein